MVAALPTTTKSHMSKIKRNNVKINKSAEPIQLHNRERKTSPRDEGTIRA